MQCKAIPVARRLLWGTLAREGMRLGEAQGLTWDDVDLKRGAVKLDRNKTDDARSWALNQGVVAALRAFRPKGVKGYGADVRSHSGPHGGPSAGRPEASRCYAS